MAAKNQTVANPISLSDAEKAARIAAFYGSVKKSDSRPFLERLEEATLDSLADTGVFLAKAGAASVSAFGNGSTAFADERNRQQRRAAERSMRAKAAEYDQLARLGLI